MLDIEKLTGCLGLLEICFIICRFFFSKALHLSLSEQEHIPKNDRSADSPWAYVEVQQKRGTPSKVCAFQIGATEPEVGLGVNDAIFQSNVNHEGLHVARARPTLLRLAARPHVVPARPALGQLPGAQRPRRARRARRRDGVVARPLHLQHARRRGQFGP